MFNPYKNLYPLLLLSLLCVNSCNVIRQPEEEAVVTVGDTSINRKEMRHEIDRIMYDMGISEQDLKTAITSIINKIVEKKLILEYGRKNGITVSQDELETAVNEIRQDYPEDVFSEILLKRYIDIREWKKNLSEELLIKKIIDAALADSVGVTFEETKNYYNTHQDELMHPRMVQVRQIVTKTKDDMDTVLDQIQKGISISELAKKHSITPEAENEGLLGWITQGKLDETIDKFVFSLKEGELSKVLSSPYGFHIFEILAVKEAGVKEFPAAIKEIEMKISMEKRETKYIKWLDSLKMDFPVSVNEDQIVADITMED